MRKKALPRKNLNNPQVKAYSRALKKGLLNHHIIPVSDGWAVKKAGSSRSSKVFSTQKKAISHGSKIARNNKTELFIHKSNGRIKSRKSYL